jgi:hypothetical protein
MSPAPTGRPGPPPAQRTPAPRQASLVPQLFLLSPVFPVARTPLHPSPFRRYRRTVRMVHDQVGTRVAIRRLHRRMTLVVIIDHYGRTAVRFVSVVVVDRIVYPRRS